MPISENRTKAVPEEGYKSLTQELAWPSSQGCYWPPQSTGGRSNAHRSPNLCSHKGSKQGTAVYLHDATAYTLFCDSIR